MRIAVVTPYFREDRPTLERCIRSVRAQPARVEHILVADGRPQDWVGQYDNVHHLVLPHNSDDFGDTPRSMGFLLAVRRDYDAIQFLDADNVLFGNHIESVIHAFAATGADMLIARRDMLRPDGSSMNYTCEEDEKLQHVDTSCFVMARTAFSVGLRWGFIPAPLACYDDRVFFQTVRHAGLRLALLPGRTVGYTCMWPSMYRQIGEEPPPGSRNIIRHQLQARAWWDGLDERRRRLIRANLGLPTTAPEGLDTPGSEPTPPLTPGAPTPGAPG